MSNTKSTQLVDVKVTINKASFTYGVMSKTGDSDTSLFNKAELRARSDFGDLLDTEKVSYEIVNRK